MTPISRTASRERCLTHYRRSGKEINSQPPWLHWRMELARVRASQLQQCVANGTEPQEAVIQATLDIIAMGQGPPGPVALADKVSLVSQTPDVQTNATFRYEYPGIYINLELLLDKILPNNLNLSWDFIDK